jgi:hypothetical protein
MGGSWVLGGIVKLESLSASWSSCDSSSSASTLPSVIQPGAPARAWAGVMLFRVPTCKTVSLITFFSYKVSCLRYHIVVTQDWPIYAESFYFLASYLWHQAPLVVALSNPSCLGIKVCEVRQIPCPHRSSYLSEPPAEAGRLLQKDESLSK